MAFSLPELARILSDLDVEVIPTRAYRQLGQTCAAATLQRLLDKHGAEHITLVLRSIIESGENARELTAPVILAMSDVVLSHPRARWLGGLDGVDLAGIADLARENRRAVKLRPAIATMLYLHLRKVLEREHRVDPGRQAPPRLDDVAIRTAAA